MARPTPKPALSSGTLTLNAEKKAHPLAPPSTGGLEKAPRKEHPVAPDPAPQPKKATEATAMLAGRVPVPLRNAFKAKAAANGLTVAEVLEHLAQQYVNEG